MSVGPNRVTLIRLTYHDPVEVLKDSNAHEIVKLSLLPNNFYDPIVRGFKTGEPARVDLVLGDTSMIDIVFESTAAHNYTWLFLPNISHLEGEEERMILDDKLLISKNWSYQNKKYTVFECFKVKPVYATLLLMRQVKALFNITLDRVIMEASALHPYICPPGIAETLALSKCKKLHVKQRDMSHGQLHFVLKNIQVSEFLMVTHNVKELKKQKFEKLDIPILQKCPCIITLKRSAMDCFEATGKNCKFIIERAKSSDLNRILLHWMKGTSQHIQMFELKATKFRWTGITKLLNMFLFSEPSGNIDKFQNLPITERLLILGMEGIDLKRGDGAVATIHFSPNTPKSKTGHSFMLHVKYPPGSQPQTSSPDNNIFDPEKEEINDRKARRFEQCNKFLNDHEALKLRLKSDTAAQKAGIPLVLKTEQEFNKTAKIVTKTFRCRLMQVLCERRQLDWEMEMSKKAYATSLDQKKREEFGYFYL